ncbi:MAG TPA: glycogen debranching protein GlgX [Steroidobacteraceae bacterium]|nr:glycogen debranching protein GlgX [Steroidobacteraceae bacterium]
MSAEAASARLAAAIEPGAATPLGATPSARGVNFVLHSSIAERIELCLYDARTREPRGSVALPGRTGSAWHGYLPAPHAAAGDLYGYRVSGPYAPDQGLWCNPAKLLLDPAARAVTGEPSLSPALFDADGAGLLDSASAMPRCRIVDPAFDWGAQRSPVIPWRDTILYELHVKGFTQRHPGVAERLRGTYLGLAEPAAVDWLRELGVTSVELMPCQAFTSERFLRKHGLSNYWGYNPIAWSAPATQYAINDPVAEFQTMVRALHAAGLEVILDVVFNHTAEGDHSGPTLSLRAIDNASYYRLVAAEPRHYENWTGCGNTIAADQPLVTALILDSLRWWVQAMHVDGFRFDLAPVLGRGHPAFNRHAAFFEALGADPVLKRMKLIAEPWDVGPDGYQLGQFPTGWSEWNDRYRDTARAFWRGDAHVQGALAERCAGSSDLFRYRGRQPSASVNFVTAHDGFTLQDLVSYRERRNDANLERNADGHAHNLSWNCGVEGPSDDPAVGELRRRQMRNLLLTLFVSQGVPMLQAGDEIARTQRGNNNAYCQDNEISWLDWSRLEAEADLVEFVRRLVALRKQRTELRREAFLKGAGPAGRAHDVSWRHPAGRDMTLADWNDPGLHCLGMWLAPDAGPGDGALLVVFNAGETELEFELPPTGHGAAWVRILDTGARAGAAALPCGPAERIASRTAIVCEARRN